MSWSPSLPSGSIFYKYEPFSYTFTGGTNFTVSGSSLVKPFCKVNSTNVVFSSTSGFQTTGSAFGEPLIITSSLGTFPFTLFLNAGRFTTTSSSVVLYQNETTTIPLTPSVSIASALVTPTLPPGLGFTGSNKTWNIVGTPTLTSASSNYLFYGSNTSQTVSTYITLQVLGERFTLTPSNVTTSITVGTPITPIVLTNDHYPNTSTSVTFSLSGLLPSGLTGTANGRTYTITGTPDAKNLTATSPSSISLTLLASTKSGALTTSVPIIFSYTSVVLFTSPGSTYQFYSNVAITSIPVIAETRFSNTSATISSYTATGLPPGLSLVNSAIQGTPTSLTTGSIVTLVATNSSGVSGTTTTTIAVSPVVLVVTSSVTTTQSYVVGRAITPVTFTVKSDAYPTITLTSLNTQFTNLPSGINLAYSGNSVTLSGIPKIDGITTGSTLTCTVTSLDGATGSGSFQYIIATDEFTFAPSTASYIFAQNTPITPIQVNVTTNSGTPVLYFTSVNLPVGLYITATGSIQGTPLEAGSGSLSFTATNGYTTVSSPVTLTYTTTADSIRISSARTSNALLAGTSNNLPIVLNATTLSGLSVIKLASSSYMYGMKISLYSSGSPIGFDSNGVPLTYSSTGSLVTSYVSTTSSFDSNGIPVTVDANGRSITVYSFATPPENWTQRISFPGPPPYTVYVYPFGATVTTYSNVSNVIDGTVGTCVGPNVVLPPNTLLKVTGSNTIGGQTTTISTQFQLQGTNLQTVMRYVLRGNPCKLYSSTDSVTYSLVSSYPTSNILDFQWNDTKTMSLVTDGTSNVYSNTTPVQVDLDYGRSIVSVAYVDKWYVIGSNAIYTSPTATTWSQLDLDNDIVIPVDRGGVIRPYGSRLIIGSGYSASNSCLQYYDIGSNLIMQTTPPNILLSVNAIYPGTIMIAAGNKGTSTICYSQNNGVSWSPCINDFNQYALDVVAGLTSGWIAIGSNTTGYGIKYSSNGISWADVVGIPTFTSIGPVQWDGTSWTVFVNSNAVYRHDALVSTILDGTTWTLTPVSFPDSIAPIFRLPTPIYGPSTVPSLNMIIGVTPNGPVFTSPGMIPPEHQYVPITPIIFDAGPGVVFFLSSTLPNGLQWTTNIPTGTANYYRASVSGRCVQTGTFTIVVYAQSDVGISEKTVSITVNQVFTSVDHATAAAYTAYTREKVIADAAVNARDNRVLPSSVGPFLLDRPKDVETVVICCD